MAWKKVCVQLVQNDWLLLVYSPFCFSWCWPVQWQDGQYAWEEECHGVRSASQGQWTDQKSRPFQVERVCTAFHAADRCLLWLPLLYSPYTCTLMEVSCKPIAKDGCLLAQHKWSVIFHRMEVIVWLVLMLFHAERKSIITQLKLSIASRNKPVPVALKPDK